MHVGQAMGSRSSQVRHDLLVQAQCQWDQASLYLVLAMTALPARVTLALG